MKRTLAFLLAACFSVTGLHAKERAGIVEFELKNEIGLQNANTIIPEMIITHLKEIDKYSLYERLLLKKILEEQELQLSGIIDENSAVKIGQLYGLEILILGSAVKTGNKITVSGRAVRVQTGEIIASGSLEFPLEEMDANLEKLSYFLAGYNEYQYRFKKYEERISKTNFGFKLGTAYSFDNTLESAREWSPLTLEMYYKSRFLDVAVFGTAPLTGVTVLGGMVNYNPFLQLGFGCAYLYVYDDILRANSGIAGSEYYRSEYNSILIGINFRPLDNIRLGLYAGYGLFGDYTYKDPASNYYDYEISTRIEFPPHAWIVFIEYDITESISIKLQWLQNGEFGTAVGYPPVYDAGLLETFRITQSLSISVGYNFSI